MDDTPEEIFKSKTWHSLYIELLSNPLDTRTDKAFCDEYQIPMTTFCRWKQKHRKQIFEEVQRTRKQYINEFRTKVLKSLGAKLDKDTNAIKLALQYMGDLVERSESHVEYRGHDEKVKRIQNLLDSIGKRKETWEEANREGVEHKNLPVQSGTSTGEDPAPAGEV